MRQRQRMMLGVFVFVMASAVIVALPAATLVNPWWLRFAPMEFDRAVWRATGYEFSYASTRLRMVDDLLERHPLVEMTREQIVELIGEPDDVVQDGVCWTLGRERSARGSHWEGLVVHLSDMGVVTRVEVGVID